MAVDDELAVRALNYADRQGGSQKQAAYTGLPYRISGSAIPILRFCVPVTLAVSDSRNVCIFAS